MVFQWCKPFGMVIWYFHGQKLVCVKEQWIASKITKNISPRVVGLFIIWITFNQLWCAGKICLYQFSFKIDILNNKAYLELSIKRPTQLSQLWTYPNSSFYSSYTRMIWNVANISFQMILSLKKSLQTIPYATPPIGKIHLFQKNCHLF